MLQTKHCSCDKGEEQGIIATDYAPIMPMTLSEAFSQSGQLISHMRTHTGKKPHRGTKQVGETKP
jgi:hypothetical protein